MGWVSATPRPIYLQERHNTHCIGGLVCPRAGQVCPRAGLDGAEKLTLTGFRFPDRPAGSEWIYRVEPDCTSRKLQDDTATCWQWSEQYCWYCDCGCYSSVTVVLY
jgi:hypothetical protein